MKFFEKNRFGLRARALVASGMVAAAGFWFGGCSGSVAETQVPVQEANAALLADLDHYETKMNALVELLRVEKEVSALDAATRELVDLSLPILDGFIELYPHCSDYLNASKAVVDEMNELSGEEIEKNYHLDAALPEGDAKCYHVKDLLVHPATVVVLLREGDLEENREQMTHEIVENKAHLGLVRGYVKSAESGD